MFKDTKEGQTHSQNDRCGEPLHNRNNPENCSVCGKPSVRVMGTCVCLPSHGSWHLECNPHTETVNTKEEKPKVNIRQSGNGYLIEITNTPIEQMYGVTRDELEQIVLYGQVILRDRTTNS